MQNDNSEPNQQVKIMSETEFENFFKFSIEK